MKDIIFLPPFHATLIAAGALALIAALALRSVRERRLVTLLRQAAGIAARVLVLAAILLIALNPTAVSTRSVEGRPRLAVLVDTSASMATRDADGKSRLEAALETLGDGSVRSRLEGDFTLDIRSFDREARAAGIPSLSAEAAAGRATDIGAALSSAVADLAGGGPQAGVLLVSDGRATTPGAEEAAQLALARSVPVWTWRLGGEVPRRDAWIEVPSSEVLSFSGAEVELSATLHQVGYDDRQFAVEVVQGEKVVGRVEATPGPGGAAPVRLKVRAPEKGEERATFRIVEDEAGKRPPERSVFLRTVGEKIRVLLAEGQPHWDTKFLVQSLKRSPHVDLTAVYRLGKDRQFAVVSKGGTQRREEKDLFPRTAEEFATFDAIVLGRGCDAFFDVLTEALLTEFVSRQGGALVFSRGKSYGGRFPALSKLEPVLWGPGVTESVRLDAASAGAEGPVLELAPAGEFESLIDRLPRFDGILQTVGVKPLAVVLAGGSSEAAAAPPAPGGGASPPLSPRPSRVHVLGTVPDDIGDENTSPVILATQLYGQGRVLTVNASGLWRWAFRVKGKEEDEAIFDRFWMGLLRWILSSGEFQAGRDVAIRSDRRLYTDEQPLRFLVRTRGAGRASFRPRIAIRGPETSTEIEPRAQTEGVYIAEAGPFPPGSYEVRLAGGIDGGDPLGMTVEVVSGSVEARVLSADPEAMERISRISEGRKLEASDVGRLGDIVRTWQARRQLADQKESLWDRWWLLAAAIALLAAEWFLRRREGLL
jgi:hypothetical protein